MKSNWASNKPVPVPGGSLARGTTSSSTSACSYRNTRHSANTDLESEDEKEVKSDDKVLVIMAGQHNPTYVATPLSVSPFSDGIKNDFEKGEDGNSESEKSQKQMENHVRTSSPRDGAVRETQLGAS
ncbi:protein GLUTAMINE DUMPER 5-like [Senna tora]|uniref:Protein GLUTAMINE DUMPER 5-like n=1 Tax=Senna tora TaxID=362788 RepID=A0A834TAI4_9FABA|nr:protein GLUTAMINE DUMPER 5-like [Senna tora]